MDEKKIISFLIRLIFWSVSALLGFIALRYLFPFLLGYMIAAVLRPAAISLKERLCVPYPFCASAVFIFSFLVFGLLLWALGATVSSQFGRLVASLPDFFNETLRPYLLMCGDKLVSFVSRFSPGASDNVTSFYISAVSALGKSAENLWSNAISFAGSFAASLPVIFLSVSFCLISSFLILLDWDKIMSFIKRQLPRKAIHPISESRRFMLLTVRRIITAYLSIMLITFAEISLGLWLLDVEYFAAIGFGVALLDILPVFGSGCVLVPWGLFLLASGRYTLSAGILILYAIVTTVRLFIEPKIVGDKIGLHPLATIISMYIGTKAFGFAGLILAPLLTTLLLHLSKNGSVRFIK